MLRSKTTRKNTVTLSGVAVVYIVMMILNGTHSLSSAVSGALIPISAYVVMALSLNLTVGILGELSLGHAGFMSIGAFSAVVASAGLGQYVRNPVVLMILCLLIGGVLTGIVGFLIGIPVLRLKGDYLAIVTLAFGEIIRNIINTLYVELRDGALHVSLFNKSEAATGKFLIEGPQGAAVTHRISTLGFGFALVMITLIVIMNLVHSKEGRAIQAIRDDPIAAGSVGLNITAYKMKAFVISAVFAGMAGVLFALNISTFQAGKFGFNQSIAVLVMVVLGGMGNLRGCVIAAVAVKLLELVLLDFADIWMLIYAVVLIAVMLFGSNARVRQFRTTLSEKLTHRFRRKETEK